MSLDDLLEVKNQVLAGSLNAPEKGPGPFCGQGWNHPTSSPKALRQQSRLELQKHQLH